MKYLIAGLAGSGKDTFGKMLSEELGIKTASFAKPIKDATLDLFGEGFDDRNKKEVCVEVNEYLLRTVAVECVEDVLGRVQTRAALREIHNTVFNAFEKFFHGGVYIISPRQFQQVIGTEVVRSFCDDAFINRIKNMDDVIVTDCRFKNEMAGVGTARVFFVYRAGVHTVNQHVSEVMNKEINDLVEANIGLQKLFHIQYDGVGIVVVDNSGSLDDLRRVVKTLV